MRLIIAGGRSFNNYDLLKYKVNKLTQNHKIDTIICGKANGADLLGERYALEYDIDIEYFIPDWDNLGKSAGYRRNVDMASNATHLIAFWKGSKGTKHMIDIMKKQNKPYKVIDYE